MSTQIRGDAMTLMQAPHDQLTARSVEVWVLPAVLDARQAERAWQVLSPSERSYARELPQGTARDRWVARCFAVRRVLSTHLGVDEAEVGLLHTTAGRLCVAAADGTQVGVSSTAHRVIVVLGDAPVGVDAEPLPVRRLELTQRWTARGAMNKAARLDPGTDLDLYVEWRGGIPRVRQNGVEGDSRWSMTSLVVESDTVVSVAVRAPDAHWHVTSLV